MIPARRLLLALAPILAGCGATTVRASVGPSLDTGGRPGVEATLGFGVGTPLDFGGRSHHYVQGLASLGGGLDAGSARGEFLAAADVDYVYWAEPRLDVRAGVRVGYRSLSTSNGSRPELGSIGGHFGLLPLVLHDDGNWLVSHLAVGPMLGMEYLWGDPSRPSRAQLSLPLLVELTFLAAGD